jgi:formamidopyrimidine-DNA glycosylase
MPELPEVETITRLLRQGTREKPASLVGCRISSADLLWQRSLAEPGPEEFSRRIVGQTIQEVGRRGKFIVISLTGDTLLIHLRMSGDMRLEDAADAEGNPIPRQKHDRLILNFSDGQRMTFNDTRKFGRVWLVEDAQTVLGGLGPEPLDPQLTSEKFHTMLNSRSRQLKPLLMDQNFLAGMGNIYTDEALFLARLHPLTRSDQINEQASARLLEAIRSVLQEGIRRNGASIDWVYRGGDFQNHFRVYSRTGEACPQCGTPIQRLVVGQRGTHICPTCQTKP